MICGDQSLLHLTDTLGLLYINPRRCDTQAADYKSLHLLPALKLSRAVAVHKPGVIFLLPAYMNRTAKVFYGTDTKPHRGLSLHVHRRGKNVAATPCRRCDYTGRCRSAL
jgi:hypothetical protein